MPHIKKRKPVAVPNEILMQHGPPVSYWGVVAVHNRFADQHVELIPNTEFVEDTNGQKSSMLRWWIAELGLPWLESKIRTVGLMIPNGKKWELHTKDGYNLVAVYRDGYIDIGAYRYDPPGERFEISAIDPTLRWGGALPIPGIDSKVFVKNLGTGRIIDFFEKKKKLGVRIYLDNPPPEYPHVLPYYMAWGEEIQCRG